MQFFISNGWKTASVFIILLFLVSGSLASEEDWDVSPQPVNGFKTLQKEVVYPENARKIGIQGKVTLKVHVDDKGKILETKILNSLEKECDEAAVNAINSVAWKPAVKNDTPIAVWFNIDIQFRLE